MTTRLLLIPVAICTLSLMHFVSSGVDASPAPQIITSATPTFDVSRLAQPSTVYPPEQADNGAQTYWGMCMDCHGDRGQGLTDEWRVSFEPEERDCWASGCHGPDFPENSFEIPETGVPALTGAGKLASFTNAFELHSFIRENMPLFPPGSLTEAETWDVTAYLLRLNDIQLASIALDKTNSSAIPIHHKVIPPKSEIPGSLILAGVLVLAAIGLGWQARARLATTLPKPNFIHHLHPPSIPALQARFRYTLGAGGLTVFLSLVLLVTGLLEMYFYVPSPEQAAISVETITTLVPFGNLIRNLHFWSAQLLVVVMTIHLLRVVLTGAYAPPRRFNFLIGLGLLA
ncbi:MAG: cytochrome b N-terminal domain-containing protein, partial [Anaerolineales bacterium]